MAFTSRKNLLIHNPASTGAGGQALDANFSTIGDALETLSASSHAPLTIGTPNGLALSTQTLSLALATSSTAGAMSSADKIKIDGIANNATANRSDSATDSAIASAISAIPAVDLSTYAAKSYVDTQDSAILTTVSSLYLSKSQAVAGYASIAALNGKLGTLTASTTYLTIADASTTYAPLTALSSYLTTSAAAATYAT